jgi:hypothetical protein
MRAAKRPEDIRAALWYKRDWNQATMAIAIVARGQNKAKKLVDLYEHYNQEIKAARGRQLATDIDFRRVGDVIGISPAGDLYVDVCDGVNYRVDKISFPPQPPKPWWQVW